MKLPVTRAIALVPGFHGFDGLDWDVEGNDDVASPRNAFAPRCLRWMGRFSQRAKQAGYVVAMAPAGTTAPHPISFCCTDPLTTFVAALADHAVLLSLPRLSLSLAVLARTHGAESYLDPTTALFDLSLTHAYPEWSHPSLQPNFRYCLLPAPRADLPTPLPYSPPPPPPPLHAATTATTPTPSCSRSTARRRHSHPTGRARGPQTQTRTTTRRGACTSLYPQERSSRRARPGRQAERWGWCPRLTS